MSGDISVTLNRWLDRLVETHMVIPAPARLHQEGASHLLINGQFCNDRWEVSLASQDWQRAAAICSHGLIDFRELNPLFFVPVEKVKSPSGKNLFSNQEMSALFSEVTQQQTFTQMRKIGTATFRVLLPFFVPLLRLPPQKQTQPSDTKPVP